MPSRNIQRAFAPDQYYHVYNRGVNKQRIFLDQQDYIVFQSLLKRYLSPSAALTQTIRLAGQAELLCFCLMPNHFHLLLYQSEEHAVARLMKSISVAYSMYFNKKYERVGPIFQQRYRAAHINRDNYLKHVSRYIHLNPSKYESWPWSSLGYFSGRNHSDWVKPDRVLDLIEGDYLDFVAEYKNRRDELEELKHELEPI